MSADAPDPKPLFIAVGVRAHREQMREIGCFGKHWRNTASFLPMLIVYSRSP